MMELKDFIRDTIVQVVEGVVEAQEATRSHRAVISPSVWVRSEARGDHLHTGDTIAQQIRFDVALTDSSGQGTKGGIGVMFGAVNLGTAGESESARSSVSRIQFSVPLILPRGDEPKG